MTELVSWTRRLTDGPASAGPPHLARITAVAAILRRWVAPRRARQLGKLNIQRMTMARWAYLRRWVAPPPGAAVRKLNTQRMSRLLRVRQLMKPLSIQCAQMYGLAPGDSGLQRTKANTGI